MQSIWREWFWLRSRSVDSRWWALVGLLVMFAIIAPMYFGTNEIATRRGVTVFDPERLFVVNGVSLDSRIPFWKWTLPFYTPLYEVMFLFAVLTYPKTLAGAGELFRLYRGVIWVMLGTCVIFLLCPAEMTLRAGAAVEGGESTWDWMFRWLYTADRPFNTWPSLHVSYTLMVTCAVSRWVGRRRRVLIWLSWALVVLSTLTTKQHYLWDVLTGCVLGLVYVVWTRKLHPPETGIRNAPSNR